MDFSFSFLLLVTCVYHAVGQQTETIPEKLVKGMAVCAKRYVTETGHEFGVIGDSYKPPCNIMEAYLACSLENTETILGPYNITSDTQSDTDLRKMMQKQINLQLRQAQLNCLINVTDLIQKIHDGTAPFLGPPGNAKTPTMDAMVTCMASYTKDVQNITSNNGNVTEMCPSLQEFVRCYVLRAGIDVNKMNESELMNTQWQFNQQIAQTEQLVKTSIDCSIDIKQMFNIGNGAGDRAFCLSILVACVLASCLLSGQRYFNYLN